MLQAKQLGLFDVQRAGPRVAAAGRFGVAVLHIRPDVSEGLARSDGRRYSFAVPRDHWTGSRALVGVFFGVDARRLIAFGLGIVHPRITRSPADRMIETTHFTAIEEIDFADAEKELKSELRANRPISSRSGSALLNAIEASDLAAAEAIEDLAARLAKFDGSDEALRLRDERDAVVLLTRFAHTADLPVRKWSRPNENAPYLAGLPHDRAFADAHRRHDLAWLDEPSIGWPQETEWLLQLSTANDRPSLLIANAVPDPVKARDRGRLALVYYHWKSGTLVRCSYLRTLAGPARRPELDRQALEDLLVDDPPPIANRENDAADIQFIRSSLFVKITTANPLDLISTKPTSGRILPADVVRPLLVGANLSKDAASISVPLPFPRHLTNTQFADLVRSGWLGMRGVSAGEVVRVVRHCLSGTGSLVLGVDLTPRPIPGNG